MDIIFLLGTFITENIILIAKLLAKNAVPGFISLILLMIVVGTTTYFVISTSRKINALKWLKSILSNYSDANFTANIITIDQEIDKISSNKYRKQINTAWKEYRETMILHQEGDGERLRNAARPSVFFNQTDLKFGPGILKIVPSLFVTAGLFLTFLGLVAALSVMDVSGDNTAQDMRESLEQLLNTASAKFIMSLTGLLCSIVFTIILRIRLDKLDDAITDVCQEIERLLTFLSLEGLAAEQLKASQNQKEYFRNLSMELVAELGRPLREELPQVISDSISNAIKPVLSQVSQAGTAGVGTMVDDLSEKFSRDVSAALEEASSSITRAGHVISELAQRMDQSSGDMNSQLLSSISSLTNTIEWMNTTTKENANVTANSLHQGTEKLLEMMSKTLDEIRTNTGAGAVAIREAATEMKSVAETFNAELTNASASGAKRVEEQLQKTSQEMGGQLSAASQNILGSFDTAANNITSASEQLGAKLTQEFLAPLDQIQTNLDKFNVTLSNNTGEMQRLSFALQNITESTETASNNIRSASTDLSSASAPIQSAIHTLERSVQGISTSTQASASTVSEGLRLMLDATETSLQSVKDVIAGEQKSIHAALAQVDQAVERMKLQSENLDDIDTKLADIFKNYSSNVQSAMAVMSQHATKMNEELSPALDTLREVVEHAERFIPQSTRR